MYNPSNLTCTTLINENFSLHFEKIQSSILHFVPSASLGFMMCVALLQFELGLLGLHGFGGHLGALQQHRCLLSWSLRLDILEQEVADEKLQALPQHSELGNS